MEKVLLTNEEIQSIKDIQEQENAISLQLGQLEYQILTLSLQKESLKNQIDQVTQKSIKTGQDLQQKYGDGNINIETGEFTKID